MFDLLRNDARLRPPLAVLLPALLGAMVSTSAKADINAKVAQLEIGKSTPADFIRVFGEPTDYLWGNRSFAKDELPETYIMAYPKRFRVVISGGRVNELRHHEPGYLFHGTIQVGSSLQEVLQVVGQPKATRESKPNTFSNGVLYKDIDGRKGNCYYARADQGVRFFFADYKVSALYLTRSVQPSTPSTVPGIARRPAPADCQRGKMNTLPTYDPDSDKIWQVDLRSYDLSALDLRSSADDLLYADFDSRTVWPPDDRMPEKFDWKRILELGKNPGLGVRKLHARGITGRGTAIAIVDQPLLTEHREYADRLRRYEEINIDDIMPSQMHGPAVASIAAGKTVGVAPGVDLYYVASWTGDRGKGEGGFTWNFRYYAQAVRRILEINEQLSKDRKIRVISMSIGWAPTQAGYQDITAACEEAKKAGMFIVSSSIERVHGFKFHGLGRSPLANPDRFESYKPGLFWAKRYDGSQRYSGRLYVPMDSRTTASLCGADEYVFYRQGGWSWAIPYIAGVYALSVQVDSTITPERFWSLAMKTGRTIKLTHDSRTIPLGPIIDPVALIEALQKKKPKKAS